MSQEAYAPPTLNSQSGAAAAFGAHASTALDSSGISTQYLCGECNSKVLLKKGDPIRCKECGHRVLYKQRTKRMVQFEAR